jgi:putative tricarboxylic transport membrane protein
MISMRAADLFMSALFVALGFLVGFDSLRLGAGWESGGPQAGFFPFILAVGMTLASVIVLVRSLRSKGTAKAKAAFIERSAVKPVLQVVIPAALMVFFTEYLGLYLSAALYMAGYIRWIGKHSWKTVIPISILLPLVCWYLFEKVFLIPMPEGSLKSFLGF